MSTNDESPRGRVVPRTAWVAVALWALFGLTHLFGLRDWVSVLSGTPVPGVSFELAAMGGALYVLSWFGAVLVGPVFAIAAALTTALVRSPRAAAR